MGLFLRETLAFYVTSSPNNPVILGFPWLRLHDPQISWNKGELRWSPQCSSRCFRDPILRPPACIQRCYEDFQEVFIDLSCGSGILFLREKGWGGFRPCIDYRGLNAITVRYPYPLCLVPAALEQLRGAKFFIKLDLRIAYNLFRIREGDEWKTTHGHYEYLVMPFGLTNALAVFQSLINEVFQDILNTYVIAYIDDILVYSTSFEEHVPHVRTVLSRLQRNHLYVKVEK